MLAAMTLGHRVLVIGSPGAGKSILAQDLGRLTGLPVVHLDRLFHDPSNRFPTDLERWRQHIREVLIVQPRWVMDGHYPATLEARVLAADSVVWLDYGTPTALSGVLRRWLRPDQPRPDMPPTWNERVSLDLMRRVLGFRFRDRPRIERLLQTTPDKHVVRLRSRNHAAVWLATLTTQS